ncbi:high affinity immunoglobulin epsilon receptor subunit alpha-like isoform X1 [Astatotilapia calliptera]|uniref:high affinity immunoglobulin epsilon receptor subunit alpha-like isoform X1 n=1 Tax=Astatotilapia calliptera TaxID=8154 RepID=UPI000E422E51|nr:high affinity immunoglobulin epsilon receptor subunit alpha-like isoform X1 [Astatotilapia calliptera]
MEVRFPTIRILLNVLLLLVTVAEFSDSQTHNSGFPQVLPNRQQFFQSEAVTISCEGLNGLTGWRVMKKINGDVRTCASTWETTIGPCKIINAYPSTDSGEYWCEHRGIQKSNSVNITVTESHVILEFPVQPVIQGENVTLHCRKKDANSNYTAEFYKNGVSTGSSSSGNIMIPTVSKSDEGLYKCSIADAGESPESWLTVGSHPTVPYLEIYLGLCIGLGVLLVVILLILVGVFQRNKHQQTIRNHTEETSLTPEGAQNSTASFRSPSSAQTVPAVVSRAEQNNETYSLITKPRRPKEDHALESVQETYSVVRKPSNVKELAAASWLQRGASQRITSMDPDNFYCAIQN